MEVSHGPVTAFQRSQSQVSIFGDTILIGANRDSLNGKKDSTAAVFFGGQGQGQVVFRLDLDVHLDVGIGSSAQGQWFGLRLPAQCGCKSLSDLIAPAASA